MSLAIILDLAAILGLGVFFTFGLAIPISALFLEFLPRLGSFFDPEILSSVKLTVFQAAVSAGISTVAGVLIALYLPRRSRVVRMLLAIPFGVPAVAAAAAWVLLLPKVLSFSLTAVVIAHVFFNTPWVALWILRALDDVPREQLEAATSLGASSWMSFRRIVAPAIAPAAGAVFAQVFSFCSMSFILVMILGGGPPVDTLETALFSKIRAGGLDLASASICAVWQIVITLVPWILFRGRKAVRLEGGQGRRAQTARSWSGRLGWLIALAFVAPYFILFSHVRLWALWDVRTQVLAGLGTSLKLALVTAVLASAIALLGVWAERRSRLFSHIGSLALVAPSGISVMTLGLGFFIAFGKALDPFSSSVGPIALLQSVFFIPVAFRVFQPIGRGQDVAAWEAALTLGASPFHAFRSVEWPRWKGPLLATFSLIAGAALGEVAAVSLFYNENRIPVALLISRWMGQYRFEQAQALSVILLLASTLLISAGIGSRARNE